MCPYPNASERIAMETLEIIRNILSANMDIEAEKVTLETTFEDLQLDSLDLVELICELEDRKGIEFGDPEGLKTVGDVVAYVDSL